MTRKTRSFRPSPALVISCIALLMALAGSAYAAGLGKNTVRSPQIVDGTVRTVDLHDGAVTAPKISPGAVGTEQLAESAVTSAKVADGSLTGADITDGSLTGADVADHSLSASDIAPHAIGAGQLANVTLRSNSATVAKGGFGTVSVNCAEGEQVISGGAQPGHFGTEMTSNRPQGNGWLYQAVNNTSGEETITVFALCLAG